MHDILELLECLSGGVYTVVFFFKQQTAYEMRISDWSSDVCSSDLILAVALLVGAVVGAQFGTRLGIKLKGEQLRGLLAVLVLAVCVKLAFDLVVTPVDLYSVDFDSGLG